MPPQLALLLTVIFVLWLFVRDAKRRQDLSGRVWIPFLWLLVMGSRPVSTWLSGTSEGLSEASNQALNRWVYLLLIFAGFIVLASSRTNWSRIVSNSKWFFVYFLYVGLSAAWAEFPFMAINQWVKDCGNIIMALIILSEENPGEAVKATLTRTSYVLVPFSFLVVKYYPEIGRTYNRWTYEPIIIGVTEDKNYLGALLLVCGAVLLWGFLDLRSRQPAYTKFDLFDHVALLLMTFWLLIQSNCATAMACIMIVACILLALKWPVIRDRLPHLTVAHFVVITLCLLFLHLVFGVGELLTGILGRDLTFTGRTEIWQRCLSVDINPLVGTGYCNFWLGRGAEKVSEGFYYKLREAHNGYLEAYLNLGLIGLGLLLTALCSGAAKIQEDLKSGKSYPAFRLAFLVVVLIYNITEAAFNGINLIWFVLLLAILEFRDSSTAEVADATIEDEHQDENQREFETAGSAGNRATGPNRAMVAAYNVLSFANMKVNFDPASRRLAVWLVSAGICLVTTSGFGVPIDPNRRIDWSHAGVGGGIPSRTNIYVSFGPGATSAQINAAILACPPNQVIYLTAGVYNLDSVIGWTTGGAHGNNITLRGAGMGQTILNFTNSTYSGDGYLFVKGSDLYDLRTSDVDGSKEIAIVSGYTKGSTSLTLAYSIPANISVGDVVFMDQVYNTNDVTPIGWAEATPAHAMLMRGNDPAGYRVQQQGFKVASFDGIHLGLASPVYMTNWDAAHLPQLFWSHNQQAVGVGFENFSVVANKSDNMGAAFAFEWATDCYVSNVATYYGGIYQHYSLGQTKNLTIQGCYITGSRSAGSDAYGIEGSGSHDLLFQNNILNGVTTPVFLDTGSAGCVIAYNYITNVAYNGGTGWFAAGIGGSHGAHPTMNLYEGNVAVGFVFDNVHGSSSDQTVFRNYVAGWVPGANAETYPILIQAHSERINIVGNVLGADGYHNNYQDTCTNILNNPRSIYGLGYWGNWSVANGVPYGWGVYANDPGVPASIYRHGNYDYATHSVIWDPTNPDTNLPPSLYLSAAPSWWDSGVPFPPIGPDVSPMVSQIPAQLWFSTAVFSSSGQVIAPGVSGTYLSTNSVTSTNRPPTPPNFHIIKK